MDQTVAGESRRYFEAAQFLSSLDNQTEAGKTGNRIECGSDVALRAAVANSVYLGLYHSAPIYVQRAPAYIPESLSEIVKIKALRLNSLFDANREFARPNRQFSNPEQGKPLSSSTTKDR